MRYAKMIDGFPVYAPNPILYNGLLCGNPPAEIYTAEGYKPVRYTDHPTPEPGYIAVPIWVETSEEIVQMWTDKPKPITEEDALIRYTNEVTGADDKTLLDATETLLKTGKVVK